MSDKPVALTPRRPSAFLPAQARTDVHIVDQLIEERCPSFVDHWSWPVARPLLYSLLGYHGARRMADTLTALAGWESFEFLAEQLAFRHEVTGLERVPKTGRVVVAANHPTGLADGVAVWEVLSRVRQDVVFFANADAIRVNPRFADVVIPVEWVMEKRSPAKTRETLRLAGEAFAQEKCIVIFPSGKLAKWEEGGLREHDWFPTVVGLARKQKADIVPLNVRARNSRLYYFFSRVNSELRDITLFHELLNKRGSRFRMTFGDTILHADLQGDAGAITEALREYVAYQLGDSPDLDFST